MNTTHSEGVWVYRLCAAQHAPSGPEAFAGVGAARTGGRWNSPGQPMAYASASRALALLEVLVHLDTLPRRSYVMVSVNLPLDLIAQPASEDLPLDWQKMGENILLRRYGDRFLSDKSFLALRVPSVVLPAEFNYLINPHHPDFEALEFGVAEPFGFDERLRPEE